MCTVTARRRKYSGLSDLSDLSEMISIIDLSIVKLSNVALTHTLDNTNNLIVNLQESFRPRHAKDEARANSIRICHFV